MSRTVLTFLRHGTTFGPEAVAAMGVAYDKGVVLLRLASTPTAMKEVLAAEIIAIAGGGETDADRICSLVVSRLNAR